MKYKTWWVKFLISYIYIGIVPVILLGIFFYAGYKMSVYKEIENSNYSALEQVLYKSDNMVEKMNSIAYHFSGIESTFLKEYSGKMPDVDEAIIAQQLKTYNSLIEGVPIQTLLYIRGDKYIYTEAGKEQYSDFEDSVKEYGDLTMSAFYKMVNSLKYNTSIKLYQSGEIYPRSESIVYYLYPIPYMESLPVATLCFSIRYDDMLELLENYLGTLKSNVFLYNEYYHDIFASYNDDLTNEDRAELEAYAMGCKGIGVYEKKIGRETYVIMRGVSQNTGFSLITINEKKIFYNRADYFEKTLFLGVVLLSVTAIVLAIVLSKKHYSPIKQLLYQVTGKSIPKIDKGYNEFEIIQSYWSDIKNKNQELNILVDRQRPLVVASSLHNLLNGKLSNPEELDFALKSARISMNHPYYFVILIPLPPADHTEQDISKSILSVVHEQVHPQWHLYGIDMFQDGNFNIAVIVNCAEKEIAGADIRNVIAELIKSDISNICTGKIKLLIGRIYEKMDGINTSFMEAMVIASDFPISRASHIVLFEQIGQEDQNNQYPVLEQALYIQCLKQANKEAALKALEQMIAVISRLGSYLIIQCLCYDIINMIIKTVNQLKGFDVKQIEIKKMCSFSSLEEFHVKCKSVTEMICDQYEAFREIENLKLHSGIINYVSSNYRELSMCLDDVANQFNITANYVSRFFKQETGYSFIQYITMLRMDRAKELLITSDMQIKDIVSDVGYIDVANFIRKFKSFEGITPNQYRETMRRK